MTDLEEAECVIAVAEMLKGRIDELALIYCARDHKGNRKPSFSEWTGNILDRMSSLLAKEAAIAQRVIDASGPNTMNRLRATSAGEG